MRKSFAVLAVLFSGLLGVGYAFAETQGYSDLAGRKWAGSRIVTRPYRAVIKANLEITNVTNGELVICSATI